MSYPPYCPGCGVSVRLKPGEAERIISEYFGEGAPAMAAPSELERRLGICFSCPDIRYGSTCRHCGCLVEVRARIEGKSCPSPKPLW